jgi:hypothetical protein
LKASLTALTVVPLFGNCARNNLVGPTQVNFDFSTIKDFHIAERQALQFRMEMFNAPNRVELGNPATGWETRTCCRRRRLARSPRPEQARARFNSLSSIISDSDTDLKDPV